MYNGRACNGTNFEWQDEITDGRRARTGPDALARPRLHAATRALTVRRVSGVAARCTSCPTRCSASVSAFAAFASASYQVCTCRLSSDPQTCSRFSSDATCASASVPQRVNSSIFLCRLLHSAAVLLSPAHLLSPALTAALTVQVRGFAGFAGSPTSIANLRTTRRRARAQHEAAASGLAFVGFIGESGRTCGPLERRCSRWQSQAGGRRCCAVWATGDRARRSVEGIKSSWSVVAHPSEEDMRVWSMSRVRRP